MPGAQGHIVVRRAPKDGQPGSDGQDAVNIAVSGENVVLTEKNIWPSETYEGLVTVTVKVYKGSKPIPYWNYDGPSEWFECSILSQDGKTLFDGAVEWGFDAAVDDDYTFKYKFYLTRKADVEGMVAFTVTVNTAEGKTSYDRELHVSTIYSGQDGVTLVTTGNPMTMNEADFTASSSWSKKATVSIYQGASKLAVTSLSLSVNSSVLTKSVEDGDGVITFTSDKSNYQEALVLAKLVLKNTGIAFTALFTDVTGTVRTLNGTIGVSVVADGEQGIDGCIVRVSEWTEGVEYHNDEELTEGTRFLDIAVISGDTANSFSAYKCLQTHTAAQGNKPPTSGSNAYWQKFNNMAPIYTPLIMAENAVIRFSQTNQLLVMKKEDNTKVAAGMGGGDYPLWVGSETPGSAPFRVSYEGALYAENADIRGKITATSGQIGGFDITENQIGGNYGNVSDGSSTIRAGMTLTKNSISFSNDDGSKSVNLGLMTIAMTGSILAQMISNSPPVGLAYPNIGIRFDIRNGNAGDYAFIGNGIGCLNGPMIGYKPNMIEPTASTTNPVTIDIREGTYVVITSKPSNGNGTLLLPWRSSVALGIGGDSTTKFAVELTIVNISEGNTVLYGGSGSGYSDSPVMYNGALGVADSWTISRGDTYRLLLLYTGGTYMAYLLSRST